MSPLQAQQDVRGGESPSLKLQQDVTDGDRPDTVRAPRTYGGKGVAEYCVRGTIDNTARCVAQQDVHVLSGSRLSLNQDEYHILQHVDGSVTVRRENGCLSTATSSIRKGRLAPTLPSRRAYGATCAKVWNVVR
jgi:hypothetical protein